MGFAASNWRALRLAIGIGLAGWQALQPLAAQPAPPAPPARPTAPACQPGPGQVAVFGQPRFGEPCRVLRPGEYKGSDALGVGARGPQSILLGRGAGVEAELCGHDTFGEPRCRRLSRSEDSLLFGGGETISWIRVREGPSSGEPCALSTSGSDDQVLVLEARVSASGGSVPFCLKLRPGDYPHQAAMGLAEPAGSGSADRREIDSWRQSGRFVRSRDLWRIVAGRGVRAQLCRQRDFAGNCELIGPGGARWGGREWQSMRVSSTPACGLSGDAVAIVHALDGAWGRCAPLLLDEYPTIKSLSLDGVAPRTVQLGPRVVATACNEEHLMGDCRELAAGATLDRFQLHSLRLRRAPLPPTPPASSAPPPAPASAP